MGTRDETSRLAALLGASSRVVALTGAGCSTGSGIPDYRDPAGGWKRRPPVQFLDFVRSPHVRRRYWARSLVGWPTVALARPNGAHRALARLEAAGRLSSVITQNVDGLHQAAGSRDVLDLHGRIDAVTCLDCRRLSSRALLQEELLQANPDWRDLLAPSAPDGDADLVGADVDAFVVPDCPLCGGVLKPDVVFFGESVPPERVARAYAEVGTADVLLIVGTSLMVFSGYRFARAAKAAGTPVAIVNRGLTRADADAALKVEGECARVLEDVVVELGDVGNPGTLGRLGDRGVV